MPIRVIIVDDHEILVTGLKSLLAQRADLQVVATARNGREAVELANKLLPDLMIMDVNMPELNGVDATVRIMADSPHTKIIALSMHMDKRFVSRMLKAGARAYVPKQSALEELLGAIDAVLRDEIYLSPKVTKHVLADLVSGGGQTNGSGNGHGNDGKGELLSSREREVLQLLAEGKNTKQIAFTLDISPKTIEFHRRQIMKKLEIDNVAELTKFAIREGLTELDS